MSETPEDKMIAAAISLGNLRERSDGDRRREWVALDRALEILAEATRSETVAHRERIDSIREPWPEEAKKAIGAVEDQYDIEVVSIGHHEKWVDKCEKLERENAELKAQLLSATDRLIEADMRLYNEAFEHGKRWQAENPVEGSWSWALEQMKAGKRVVGGDFAVSIYLEDNSFIAGDRDSIRKAEIELCDLEATNWRIVPEGE